MPVRDKLFDRLQLAKWADLLELLKDLKIDLNKYKNFDDFELIYFICRVLRSGAGSSLSNVAGKPHELPYKQILIDVADRLCSNDSGLLNRLSGYMVNDGKTIDVIENYIHRRVRIIWNKHIYSNKIVNKEDWNELFNKEMKNRSKMQFNLYHVKNVVLYPSGHLVNKVLGSNYKKWYLKSFDWFL